jgi:hypothetical protein
MKWEKFALPSELPNKTLYKIDTEEQGALRLQFSNKGKFLAIACTMNSGQMGAETQELKGSKTIIKIVNIEDGKTIVVLRGHHDLIHDLDWS